MFGVFFFVGKSENLVVFQMRHVSLQLIHTRMELAICGFFRLEYGLVFKVCINGFALIELKNNWYLLVKNFNGDSWDLSVGLFFSKMASK